MLVAEHLTNRQIAERLVISPKTVEHHIEHIFAKLGVSSRGAVARLVLRQRPALHEPLLPAIPIEDRRWGMALPPRIS